VKKGDPLQTARLAGMLAAKRTADLIPLCHPLPLSLVEVLMEARPRGYVIRSRVRTTGRTGVEMEALVAVATAALTLYDMLKAIDRAMVIESIALHEKTGGKSGDFRRDVEARASAREPKVEARASAREPKVEARGSARERKKTRG